MSRREAALIEGLLGGDDRCVAPLRALRARATPWLVGALADPRAGQPAGPSGVFPVVHICELLGPAPPAEAVEALDPYLDHPEEFVRERATAVLVSAGAPRAGEALARALRAAPDAAGRRPILMRLFGLREGRRDPGFVAPLVEALAGTLDRSDADELSLLAEVLLRLDPARGLEALTDPSRFRPDHPAIVSTLIALHRAGVVAPPDRLAHLLPALKLRSDRAIADGEGPRPFEAALPVLARSDPGAARPEVDEALASPDPIRRGAAADALEILAGVEHALRVVGRHAWTTDADGLDTLELDRLTPARRHYWLAFTADAEICNGGLRQFFLNPSGLHAGQTSAALDAIGAPTAAEAVRRACELVGGLEPAGGETLYDALRRPDVDARLEALEREYFAEPDGILTLLKRYAARHADEFREPEPT